MLVMIGGESPDLTGKTISFVVSDGDISQKISHQVSTFTGTIVSKVSGASLWQVVLFALLGGLIPI